MVRDLVDGSTGTEIFLCNSVSKCQTKNGSAYLSMVLQDKSGKIDAKLWDAEAWAIPVVGDLLRVQFTVSTFNGKLQLRVLDMTTVPTDAVDLKDFMICSKYDIDQMYSQVEKLLSEVKDPWLKRLADSFLEDEEFQSAVKTHAGAKSVHHAYMGGWLQHTLFVMKIARSIGKLYGDSVNLDLVTVAAFLHDVGKLRELSGGVSVDYTVLGNLWGHISIGAIWVYEKCKGFPPEVVENVVHCILAHHGEQQFGSPTRPALVEAVILHFADNADARINIFLENLENNVGVYSSILGTVPCITKRGEDVGIPT